MNLVEDNLMILLLVYDLYACSSIHSGLPSRIMDTDLRWLDLGMHTHLHPSHIDLWWSYVQLASDSPHVSLCVFLSVLVSQRSDAEDEDSSDHEVQSVTMSLPDMSLLSTIRLSPSPTSSLASDSLPSHDDLWAPPHNPWHSELPNCVYTCHI